MLLVEWALIGMFQEGGAMSDFQTRLIQAAAAQVHIYIYIYIYMYIVHIYIGIHMYTNLNSPFI